MSGNNRLADARRTRNRIRAVRHRLEQSLRATEVELTPSDLRELANAASNIAIQGERYPEELGRRMGL